jgi:ankyrin repeat protein
MAVRQCEPACVQLLLDASADARVVSSSGDFPLLVAAQQGRGDIVRLLLAAAAPADANQAKAGTHRTPLHEAAEGGHDAVVAQLLAAAADVNAKTTHRATALHLAAREGHEAVVRALVAARGASVNAIMAHGETPLLLAASARHAGVVAALLAAGAQPDVLTGEGMTPLFVACAHGEAAAHAHKGRRWGRGARAGITGSTAEYHPACCNAHWRGVCFVARAWSAHRWPRGVVGVRLSLPHTQSPPPPPPSAPARRTPGAGSRPGGRRRQHAIHLRHRGRAHDMRRRRVHPPVSRQVAG